ncbi:EF-hand domain-containing protein [Thiolapillus brandeum]|uniref:EF-hand domain-containing protein n=1 Tax=Thiolapillus brandeum TaxID=1076588 RepID=A0A7U6JJD4_9GAMM|nr:hypothetical protein [Thiolapillus brandeum]BAO45547.1 conserved hypothetical protein [Thiolapillus brandeum]
MSKKIVLTILGTLFAVSAVAGGAFSALDRDMNGRISKQEASAIPSLSEQWDSLDKDASGDLSKEEYLSFESAGASSEDTSAVKDAPKASQGK